MGDAGALYLLVADKVFPFIKTLGSGEGSTYSSRKLQRQIQIPGRQRHSG